MQCDRCGFTDLEGAEFCPKCAAPLTTSCGACGVVNPAGAARCAQCAAPLGVTADARGRRPRVTRLERARGKQEAHGRRGRTSRQVAARPGGTPASQAPQPDAREGERRHLTVMFCDLVESTALSARLDPEDLRHVIASYQAACAEMVERFEGRVARYLGDGILVYFGYPRAHEDDARRAVYAALDIISAVDGLNARLEREHGVRLAVRIGIDTGLVVAGELAGAEQREPFAIFGETPNVAARLQSLAEPNQVVVSAATHELIRGQFECESLGAHELKGIPQPMRLYLVVRESGARSRLEASAPAGLTALVDREQEMALLADRWSRVRERSGQVVLISGEAGIGKSRLVRVLKERVAGETHLWLECYCSPYYQSSPLYPVIDLLTQGLGWTRHDSPETKLTKLEQGLTRASFAVSEVLPPLAGLLSLPLAAPPPGPVSSPARRKQQVLEALRAWLARIAAERPVVLVVDDLHWIDPSTLEFLSLLVDRLPPLLLLLTARPEFHPPWPMHAHVTQLTLSRLGREHVAQMAEYVAGDRPLPPGLVQQLVGRTDGIPLFVEELTKLCLESDVVVREDGARYEGAGSVSATGIPASLHDSLMARLDRLASAKSVAQLGATLGREFTYELLHAVASFEKRSLGAALTQLVDAELLYQRGVPPDASYSFKHALIRDAAYESLLKSSRQQYHERIAQVLTERFPEVAASQPELVAHHYTEGALGAQAVNYWYMAAQRAVESSANLEAISYLGKAIGLLAAVPATGERTHVELALQTLLGFALMSCKGYGAPEVEAAFRRARELCQDLGEAAQPFPVLRGLWAFAIVRGRLSEARVLADQLLDIARRAGDNAFLIEAYYALGCTLFYLGEPRASHDWSEQGIALYDPVLHRSHTQLYGADPGVTCRCYAAVALWQLGRADQAVVRIREAQALAEETAQPVNAAFGFTFGAVIHQSRGDVEATRQCAEAAVALATEQVLPFWASLARIFTGWAWFKEGNAGRGIAEIERGLAENLAAGAEVGRPKNCALLAEAFTARGDTPAALAALAEAFDAVTTTGARYEEAELHQLRGEALLARAQQGGGAPLLAEAEACLRRGIELARRQPAPAFELRCATSLSRLLQRRGTLEEARRVLAPIYASFTEGLDTADLQAARALLAQLQ
jgi:class 3 adenylate cyclase/predicted ATPase